MRKSVLNLFAVGLCGLVSTSAMAVYVPDTAVYGRVGTSGIGVGGAYALSENVTLRGDFSSFGAIKRDFKQRDINYSAKVKNDKLNLMFDFFPFDNGLRLTSGLGFLRTSLTATGVASSSGNRSFKIGNRTYNLTMDSNDTVNASFKYPVVSPYIGLGYGHHIKQQKGGEWGFLVDLGVYLGKGKSSLNVSQSLNDKLVNAELDAATVRGETLTKAQAQASVNDRISQETQRFTDRADKFKVIPVISVGVSYRF